MRRLDLPVFRLRHGLCGVLVSPAAAVHAQPLLHHLPDIQLGCDHGGHAPHVRALLVLLRWEISAFIYPERFFEETNASLSCANCRDKLCKLREPIFESLAPTSKRGDAK